MDDPLSEDVAKEVSDAFLLMLHDAQLVTQQSMNYMSKRAKKKGASVPMVLMCMYLVLKKNYQGLMRGELGMDPEVARQMFAAVDQHFTTVAVDGKGREVQKH